MNIKIQGGGSGVHANNGSSVGITSYLEHENKEKIKEGKFDELKPFFSHTQDKVKGSHVSFALDNNKRKLMHKDSKFFVLTFSPSEKEIAAMGEDKNKAMQDYTRKAMQLYAENFDKGLNGKDLMYFAKVHEERKKNKEVGLHAHVIVSRKDITNTKKLSPKTNHRSNSKGAVSSGFNRSGFFDKCESEFDKHFNYKRDFKQSYDYLNTMKNGTPKDIKALVGRKELFQKSIEIAPKLKEQKVRKINIKPFKNRGLSL